MRSYRITARGRLRRGTRSCRGRRHRSGRGGQGRDGPQGGPLPGLLSIRVRRLARHDQDPGRPVALGPRLQRDRRAQSHDPREILRGRREGPGRRSRSRQSSALLRRLHGRRKIDKAGVEPLEAAREGGREGQEPEGPHGRASGAAPRPSPGPCSAIGVVPDFKNPDMNIAHLQQGGLGLPDRDYYLKDDDKSKQIRDRLPGARARCSRCSARSRKPRKQGAQQDPRLRDQAREGLAPARRDARSREDLQQARPRRASRSSPRRSPGTRVLQGDRLPGRDADQRRGARVLPGPRQELAGSHGRRDAAGLPALAPRARDAAPVLSKAFADENFDFYGKKLAGQKEQQARWKRCVDATDGALGEILGQAFVEKQFAGDSKTIALEHDRADRDRRSKATSPGSTGWTTRRARARAGKKQTLANKIGYPDKWRDYSKLAIKKGDYFAQRRRRRAGSSSSSRPRRSASRSTRPSGG